MKEVVCPSQASVNEQIYAAVKQDILTLSIRAEERIKEGAIAEKYGVSRTPVRKAIEQLIDEGLIISKNDKLYPYHPSRDDMYNICVLRSEVSVFAMIQASQKLDTEKMDKLYLLAKRADDAIISSDKQEQTAAELEFHDYLIECSENPFLIFLRKRMADKLVLTINSIYDEYDHRHCDETLLPSSHRLLCNNQKEYIKTGALRPLELAVEHHMSFSFPVSSYSVPSVRKTSTEVVKMADFFLDGKSSGVFSDDGDEKFDSIASDNPFQQKNRYVYDYLLKQIILGQIQANDKLSITSLADRLNISRSPVRDAVEKLISEGYLAKTGKNTISIKSFSEDEINNIYYARMALESAASALAARFSTPKEMSVIRKAHENFSKAANELDTENCIIYDCAFHTAIVNACHNQFLIDAYQSIYPNIRMWVWQASKIQRHSASVWKNIQKDHERIIDYLNRRNPEGAKISMKQHMNSIVSDYG